MIATVLREIEVHGDLIAAMLAGQRGSSDTVVKCSLWSVEKAWKESWTELPIVQRFVCR